MKIQVLSILYLLGFNMALVDDTLEDLFRWGTYKP